MKILVIIIMTHELQKIYIYTRFGLLDLYPRFHDGGPVVFQVGSVF